MRGEADGTMGAFRRGMDIKNRYILARELTPGTEGHNRTPSDEMSLSLFQPLWGRWLPIPLPNASGIIQLTGIHSYLSGSSKPHCVHVYKRLATISVHTKGMGQTFARHSLTTFPGLFSDKKRSPKGYVPFQSVPFCLFLFIKLAIAAVKALCSAGMIFLVDWKLAALLTLARPLLNIQLLFWG